MKTLMRNQLVNKSPKSVPRISAFSIDDKRSLLVIHLKYLKQCLATSNQRLRVYSRLTFLRIVSKQIPAKNLLHNTVHINLRHQLKYIGRKFLK